jgi:hypothetical protein
MRLAVPSDALRRALWLAMLGAGDGALESRFGHPLIQRLLFAAMARGYRPDVVPGFGGTVAYTLTRPVSGGEDCRWTIDIAGERAVAAVGTPGPDSPVAVRVRLTLADFVRIATGKIDPAEPLLSGRATFTGEIGLAARLPEMFGAPRLG